MALLDKNLNYFSYSPQLKDILSKLGSKVGSLTQYPAGMSPQERNAVINQMTEKIRAGEKPEVESMRVRMARQGLLGSGIEETERGEIGRGYNEAVAGAKRDVTIDEMRRKASETIASANAAGGLAGLLMGGETGAEGVNAARRGEGRMDIQMLLELLKVLYGQQSAAVNPYAQAVMTQYGSGGGGMD
ncbi:MAG: hypothetical protein MIO92_02870, partial [Methanosarcinaceae archaeon]|nr:hypothetical protein [Methanosarcinaceae archaeon]